MHGLHKRLDGVEKGKPSAIDLHNQGNAIKILVAQATVNLVNAVNTTGVPII